MCTILVNWVTMGGFFGEFPQSLCGYHSTFMHYYIIKLPVFIGKICILAYIECRTLKFWHRNSSTGVTLQHVLFCWPRLSSLSSANFCLRVMYQRVGLTNDVLLKKMKSVETLFFIKEQIRGHLLHILRRFFLKKRSNSYFDRYELWNQANFF